MAVGVSAWKASAGAEVLKEAKPEKYVTHLSVYYTLGFVGGKCCGSFTDTLES